MKPCCTQKIKHHYAHISAVTADIPLFCARETEILWILGCCSGIGSCVWPDEGLLYFSRLLMALYYKWELHSEVWDHQLWSCRGAAERSSRCKNLKPILVKRVLVLNPSNQGAQGELYLSRNAKAQPPELNLWDKPCPWDTRTLPPALLHPNGVCEKPTSPWQCQRNLSQHQAVCSHFQPRRGHQERSCLPHPTFGPWKSSSSVPCPDVRHLLQNVLSVVLTTTLALSPFQEAPPSLQETIEFLSSFPRDDLH